MKKAALLILTIITLSCQEDYYPPGLYGYQVERLLTGGGEKTWFADQLVADGLIVPVEDCRDSVWIHFQRMGTANRTDSLVGYEIRPDINCGVYDSIYFGAFYASGRTGPFRDSLIFRGGEVNYALVDYIDSDDLTLRYTRSGSLVQVRLKPTEALGISPRQIGMFLTGGQEQGAERTFFRNRLRIDNEVQEFSSCQDSVRLRFERTNNQINGYQLTPLGDCQDINTEWLGSVSFSSANGFFTDTLFFSGGTSLDTVLFELNNKSSFAVRYRQDTLQYNVDYMLDSD